MSDTPFDLSIGRAAAALGVSVQTLRGWAATGKIRARRTPGDRWRFAQADLDAFSAAALADAEASA